MSFEYESGQAYNAYHPTNLSPWMHECFSLVGFNSMLAPAQGIRGTAISPSWTFTGDERTGVYNPAYGVIGFALSAFPGFLFSVNQIVLGH